MRSILSTGKIREVQVTLDGTESVHNSRRFLKGGEGTFDRIVRGIDAVLKTRSISISGWSLIRKILIIFLIWLRFAIDKGWTKSRYFKTQIGRNYELHHCQSAPDKLFDRISLYESIYELIQEISSYNRIL